jgi:hypothetical protein
VTYSLHLLALRKLAFQLLALGDVAKHDLVGALCHESTAQIDLLRQTLTFQ